MKKKLAIPLIVGGGALAAYGLAGYSTLFSASGWSRDSQIEIAIGVAALLYDLILRRDSKPE